MSEFILKLERSKEFEVNPYRRYVGVISIVILILAIVISLYSGLYLQAVLVSCSMLLYLPDSYKMATNNYINEVVSAGECLLEFREERLFCKYNNKISWSIPFNKISHIETCSFGSGRWFSPKIKETYIYSNVSANDTYPLPGAISEADREIIQKELEAIKNTKSV